MLRSRLSSPFVDCICRYTLDFPSRSLRMVPKRRLPAPKTEKRLDVVILGAPNAGKSVLLNTLVRDKIAATTHKSFTTRMKIIGVYNDKNIQLAFHDTPGFERKLDTRKREARALRDLAETAANEADVVLLVVDAAKKLGQIELDSFAEMVQIAIGAAKVEIVLVLNKVDLVVPKSKLLATTRELVSLINGVKLGEENKSLAELDTTTFMISALAKDGVVDLKNYLLSLATPKQWLIPKGSGNTDLTLEERVEEIVLEAMLENTHDEIPYIAEISCISMRNISSKLVRVDVDIMVANGAQQRIVIGQQGRTLVKIRQTASDIIGKTLKRDIILYLWVKLKNPKEDSSAML